MNLNFGRNGFKFPYNIGLFTKLTGVNYIELKLFSQSKQFVPPLLPNCGDLVTFLMSSLKTDLN